MEALIRFWHRLSSPRWFYEISSSWPLRFGVVSALLLGTGCVWGLVFAPADYQQGDSFRIIYIHVPAAIVAQSAYLVAASSGFVLLVWRLKLADMLLVSILPFGAAATALNLFTGAAWGKPTWGSWWFWDARTTSMLVLFFLYIGLMALREAIPRAEKAGKACAILVLVGVVNIPIIKYSVDWWLTLHQPATFTLTDKPSMPVEMWIPLAINVVGAYLLLIALVVGRLRVEILYRQSASSWVQDLVKRYRE
tara:strand:- start:2189 stop:2941 length:753 start_codon:yes stop_codon:yes gene_type:complete